jgi:hypothetical protein
MLVALLTLALQQQPASVAPSDTLAIQKVARDHLKYDAPVAQVYLRGDTAYVHVGNHISWTQVRVVRRREQWVALKDTVEVRGIR